MKMNNVIIHFYFCLRSGLALIYNVIYDLFIYRYVDYACPLERTIEPVLVCLIPAG